MKALIIPVLAGALALSACQSETTRTEPASTTNISLAITALTAAERAALIYTQLPPCPGGGRLCADPAVKARIKAADATAYDAVVAAYRDPALVDAAMSAVGALSALIPAPARQTREIGNGIR